MKKLMTVCLLLSTMYTHTAWQNPFDNDPLDFGQGGSKFDRDLARAMRESVGDTVSDDEEVPDSGEYIHEKLFDIAGSWRTGSGDGRYNDEIEWAIRESEKTHREAADLKAAIEASLRENGVNPETVEMIEPSPLNVGSGATQSGDSDLDLIRALKMSKAEADLEAALRASLEERGKGPSGAVESDDEEEIDPAVAALQRKPKKSSFKTSSQEVRKRPSGKSKKVVEKKRHIQIIDKPSKEFEIPLDGAIRKSTRRKRDEERIKGWVAKTEEEAKFLLLKTRGAKDTLGSVHAKALALEAFLAGKSTDDPYKDLEKELPSAQNNDVTTPVVVKGFVPIKEDEKPVEAPILRNDGGFFDRAELEEAGLRSLLSSSDDNDYTRQLKLALEASLLDQEVDPKEHEKAFIERGKAAEDRLNKLRDPKDIFCELHNPGLYPRCLECFVEITSLVGKKPQDQQKQLQEDMNAFFGEDIEQLESSMQDS